ncbi:hypothetical protein [Paenibacillus sp. GCM10012306]|uniref:hypothetical protein n=1 Tax=Paenibacillus sp. GCM10012306 TaxID=3317342 RepID=UPI00361D3E21
MADGRLALKIQESLDLNASSKAINEVIIALSEYPSLKKINKININQTLINLLNNELKSAVSDRREERY